MNCPQCNSENLDNAKFCQNCGKTLSSEVPSTSSNIVTEANKKRSGCLKPLLIFFGVLILLIIFVASLGNNNDSPNSSSNSSTSSINTKDTSSEEQAKTDLVNYYQETIPRIPDEDAKMDPKTYAFLKNNSNLFPAKKAEDLQKLSGMVDGSIEYKYLMKNITPYLEKIISVTGCISQIQEIDEDGQYLTYGILVTEQEEYYQFIYKEKIDVFENDIVTCIALPISTNTFSNTDGGSTHSIIILAGDMKKISSQDIE